MKTIIGLGNPGNKYQNTRHNVGFLAIDYLLQKWNLVNQHAKNNFDSQIWESLYEEEKILIIKPQTYMNDSGKGVKKFCDFYKLTPQTDILVLHDEVDLPFGVIRSTANSSSAGQNGVQNTIDQLGTQEFHRLRIGVETRESRSQIPTRDFVLSNFTPEELQHLQKEVFFKTLEVVESFIKKK